MSGARRLADDAAAKMRVTTVRLPEALAEELEMTARVDGITASRIIRDAIEVWVAQRMDSTQFRAAAAAMVARDEALLAARGVVGATTGGTND